MITHLVSPSTARAVFSADELPPEIQQPLLRNLVTPRVISASMLPTLRPGDQLEIEAAEALQTGDVIIYRQGGLLICHRLARLAHGFLYTKGDAHDGPPEPIKGSDVMSRVTALVRNGERLPVPPRPQVMPELAGRLHTQHPAKRSCAQARVLVRQCLTRIIEVPGVNLGTHWLMRHVAVVDVMEQAPLVSLVSYVRLKTFRLSHTTLLSKYLRTLTISYASLRLVLRAGPVILGTCRIAPWCSEMRPIGEELGLAALFHTLHAEVGHRSPVDDTFTS